MDKESVEEEIAKLRQLEQQQWQQADPEQQVGPLNLATINSKPLWRKPRTHEHPKTEQAPRTRITFTPQSSAVAAAEFRRQQQRTARQNLVAIQQVAAIRLASIQHTLVALTATNGLEENISEQVHQRVAAIQQDFEQRSANRVAQLTEDITNEE